MSPATIHLLQQVSGFLQFANATLIFPRWKDVSLVAAAGIQIFSGWVQQAGNKAEPPPKSQ